MSKQALISRDSSLGSPVADRAGMTKAVGAPVRALCDCPLA